MHRIIPTSLAIAVLLQTVSLAAEPDAAAKWKPAEGPLLTRWADDVSPENVHAEYPRPLMVRPDWTNLNGLWEYAITPKDASKPDEFGGRILVPFPIESALSGVGKRVGPGKRLWYRRTFEKHETPANGRLVLHFGAVDWDATVYVNGKQVGAHKGGYDPFSFDVTDALTDGGAQELVVSVWDPSDAGYQPRGKQVQDPKGIWYTPVTGIWRTVWLEPVPAGSIARLKITPDVDARLVRVTAVVRGDTGPATIAVDVFQGDRKIASATGTPNLGVDVKVPDARLWSPDSPFLYGLKVRIVGESGDAMDSVESYFGMRKIAVARDKDGFNRLFLNGKPLFQYGPLDQGWWPDGLYTAPTDAALLYDVQATKEMGFNMIRKHVKTEPARWYHHCDRLGMLVWQDMPNGDRHISPDQPDIERSAESAANYRREWQAIIDAYHNHPSIVVWVPFNEGWGQFQTDDTLAWTKRYDPTRLVDGPSGWADRGTGDMNDMHRYPGPAMPKPEKNRAVVLGEFGGLGLPLEEHLWQDNENWGYRTYRSVEELRANYEQLMRRLHPLIGEGLAAAVYTQTTDVEGEVNGLLTYDRDVNKMGADFIAKANSRLYSPPPIVERTTIVATSEKSPQTWRYTTEKPPEGWAKPAFDDSAWKQGPGGFGERTTPGTVVRTEWKTDDVWLRREFTLEKGGFINPMLRIHHDEDAEVYLDGKKIVTVKGYVTEYVEWDLPESGRKALTPGKHTLAVHCHQTGGGQYIDAGLVNVVERPRE